MWMQDRGLCIFHFFHFRYILLIGYKPISHVKKNCGCYAIQTGLSLYCLLDVPPDFYPAYRRVKAGENGCGLA